MAKNPYNDKKKASNKKYMDSLSRISVWVTPEEKILLVDKADAEEKSLNGYIRNALGLKDKPKTVDFTGIVNNGGLNEDKLKEFCSNKGLVYKSYEFIITHDHDEDTRSAVVHAGYPKGYDEYDKSTPYDKAIIRLENEAVINLSLDEIEHLK